MQLSEQEIERKIAELRVLYSKATFDVDRKIISARAMLLKKTLPKVQKLI